MPWRPTRSGAPRPLPKRGPRHGRPRVRRPHRWRPGPPHAAGRLGAHPRRPGRPALPRPSGRARASSRCAPSMPCTSPPPTGFPAHHLLDLRPSPDPRRTGARVRGRVVLTQISANWSVRTISPGRLIQGAMSPMDTSQPDTASSAPATWSEQRSFCGLVTRSLRSLRSSKLSIDGLTPGCLGKLGTTSSHLADQGDLPTPVPQTPLGSLH